MELDEGVRRCRGRGVVGDVGEARGKEGDPGDKLNAGVDALTPSFGDLDHAEGANALADLANGVVPRDVEVDTFIDALRPVGVRTDGAAGSGTTDITSIASFNSSSSISTLVRGTLSNVLMLDSIASLVLPDKLVPLTLTLGLNPLNPIPFPPAASKLNSDGTGRASPLSGTSSKISK